MDNHHFKDFDELKGLTEEGLSKFEDGYAIKFAKGCAPWERLPESNETVQPTELINPIIFDDEPDPQEISSADLSPKTEAVQPAEEELSVVNFSAMISGAESSLRVFPEFVVPEDITEYCGGYPTFNYNDNRSISIIQNRLEDKHKPNDASLSIKREDTAPPTSHLLMNRERPVSYDLAEKVKKTYVL